MPRKEIDFDDLLNEVSTYDYEESKVVLTALLINAGVEMTNGGFDATIASDKKRILDKMGVRFEVSHVLHNERTLTIKASACEDLILIAGHKDGMAGFYLPFKGLVAPETKWLRSIHVSEDGDEFKLFFGYNLKDKEGKDTLVYTYKKRFSMSYGASTTEYSS